MDKLPVEVLNQIFRYFNQAQKVECMLVCRHWSRTIQDLSLFETVWLSSMDAIVSILELIKEQPHVGTKVERLFFDTILSELENTNDIPLAFPNLKVLFIHCIMYDFDVDLIPTDGWCKNIEVLVEYDDSRLTRNLLSSARRPKLNTLYFRNRNFTGSDIVPHFANAPALTELYITDFRATISDYELLHQHLPGLRKLTIRYGDITSSQMPKEIEPPKCLESLSITYIDIVQQQNHSAFLKYIGKKYINVVNLMLYINCEGIRFGNGYEFHKDEWNPVLDTMGSQLKSIGIEAYAVPEDFFARLDKANCQIQNLTIHGICLDELSEKLVTSQQKDHIEKLVIDYAVEKFTQFDYLSELPKLKNLTVNYNHVSKEPVLWNEFMSFVPVTVETLTLSKYTIKCNLKTDQVFGHIKELYFNNCHIPRNFDTFVTAFLPNVKLMSFEECKFSIRRLKLPQHNLDEFQMIACRPDGINVMLVETLDDGKKRGYYGGDMNQFIDYKELFNLHDVSAYPANCIMPSDDVKLTTYVSLLCSSLKNLILFNKPTST